MYIVSEILDKTFDTVEECLAAEAAYEAEQKEKEAKKKKLAEEKEKRKAEVDEAREVYMKLRNAYLKDYGVYTSITASDNDLVNFIKSWYK